MKKYLPILIGVFIVGIGAYAYLTGGQLSFTGGGINISKTTYTGTIKDAVEKGIPLKCISTQEDATAKIGYIKGKKYYGEVVQKGKPGYIIMVDNCFWTWEKGAKQGAKMCFEGDLWTEQGKAPEGMFKCESANVPDSMFTPPSDVQFLDVDKMMGGEQE